MGLSLEEKAYQAIKQKIMNGEFPSGTALSENELAESLEMSRTPIRAALTKLASEGFINQMKNRGAVVKEVSIKEVNDLFELRRSFEEFSIREIFRRNIRIDLSIIKEYLKKQEEAMKDNDYWTYIEYDRKQHLEILRILGNNEMIRVMENLRDKALLCGLNVLIRHKGMIDSGSIQEHKTLIKALEDRDMEGALEAVRIHTENAKNRTLNS